MIARATNDVVSAELRSCSLIKKKIQSFKIDGDGVVGEIWRCNSNLGGNSTPGMPSIRNSFSHAKSRRFDNKRAATNSAATSSQPRALTCLALVSCKIRYTVIITRDVPSYLTLTKDPWLLSTRYQPMWRCVRHRAPRRPQGWQWLLSILVRLGNPD